MIRTQEGAPSAASRVFAPAMLAAGIVMGLVAGQAAPLIADALAPAPESRVQASSAVQALGLGDDYATRHPRAEPRTIGQFEDYALRHSLGVQLGQSDDYGLRHAMD